MKPEIFIRTDGNQEIGLGHLIRCMALANMLKNDFRITFICKTLPDSIKFDLHIKGFNFQLITYESDFLKSISKSSIIVLDGYNFNTTYQKIIKDAGAKLICIDDLHNQEFFADLIINHAPGITSNEYQAQPYTKFALGLEYALLRSSFLQQAKKERIIETVETVMICFGGSDLKNLTKDILHEVIDFVEFRKIIVITGTSYCISDDFNDLLKKDKRIEHLHNLNEKQMLKTMLKTDLAIVPASGILFEVLSAGCLVISGYYVTNQKSIYNGFLINNMIFGANNFESVKSQIEHSFNTNFIQRDKIIDGESGLRLTKIFNRIC